uniref:BovF n=2 Tax=Streptococcus TaxID=1301 RepID=B1PW42_STREI|nr:BovF [Streptococcus equinus]
MDIKLCKINKNYGSRKILKGLNVNVPSGEIYGFIGANGSGKTTTMKIMTGLTPANHGVVKFDGLTLKELAKSEKSFGAFISTPTYYKNLTAVENLTIVQDILGKPKSEVYRVLELVGLSEAADKEVRSFSFGMKQRLGLAFAFLNNPDILILDEPTNGLDPKGIVEIRELLRRLSQEEGKTIFISSHNISEIEAIADRVGIIHQGSLVFEGTLDELYRSNRSTYILEVNDEEKARQLLTEKRIDFMNHQTRFEINLSKSNIPSLLKELIEREISVYEMTPNKNLERIFLNLTAGGTEDAISY